MTSKQALVVGAGVTGLTTAVCLAEQGIDVRVIARELPEQTTSAAAGAVWAPYRVGGDPELIDTWARHSLTAFTQLARLPTSGVRIIPSMETANQPIAAPEWAPMVAGARPCTPAELPHGHTHGWRFEIPAIDMPTYLTYLAGRLQAAGGTIEQAHAQSLDELLDLAPVLVNCAGLGARELADDSTLHAVRGQIVAVANPGVSVGMVEAELEEDATELTYLIPHGDTLVLGGTDEPGDERTDPDPAITRSIIARCARLDPRVANAPVLAQRVGLRPERDAVRLDSELRDRTTIWHNYGHGGAGVTLSWGCAQQVLAGVLGAH